MVFDLIGLQPRNEKGKCFSTNMWGWQRLAEFVLSACQDCFKEGETEYWHTNDGQQVSEETALMIAERLKEYLEDEATYRFSPEWEQYKGFAEFCENSGGFEIW